MAKRTETARAPSAPASRCSPSLMTTKTSSEWAYPTFQSLSYLHPLLAVRRALGRGRGFFSARTALPKLLSLGFQHFLYVFRVLGSETEARETGRLSVLSLTYY